MASAKRNDENGGSFSILVFGEKTATVNFRIELIEMMRGKRDYRKTIDSQLKSCRRVAVDAVFACKSRNAPDGNLRGHPFHFPLSETQIEGIIDNKDKSRKKAERKSHSVDVAWWPLPQMLNPDNFHATQTSTDKCRHLSAPRWLINLVYSHFICCTFYDILNCSNKWYSAEFFFA